MIVVKTHHNMCREKVTKILTRIIIAANRSSANLILDVTKDLKTSLTYQNTKI